MKLSFLTLFGLMAKIASGVEVTKETFDYYTEGKMALIKFYTAE